MEQNRLTRNRPAQIKGTDFWQRTKVNTMENEYLFNKLPWDKMSIGIQQQKKNSDTDHTTYTKINSKWITDLTVNLKVIKLLEKKNKRKSQWPWVCQQFFRYNNRSRIHERKKKKKKNELGFIKTKTSALWKTLLRKWKEKPQRKKKYLQNAQPIKDCYPNYTNNS